MCGKSARSDSLPSTERSPVRGFRSARERPEGPERSSPSGDGSAVENPVGVHLTAGLGVQRIEGQRLTWDAGEQDAGEEQEAEAMRTTMSHTSLLSVTEI